MLAVVKQRSAKPPRGRDAPPHWTRRGTDASREGQRWQAGASCSSEAISGIGKLPLA